MKPDTLENHYDNLLIGAEDWAIQQVKEDIQRLRKENAELEETKKAFAPTFMREMHAECLRLECENTELKAWKESALILNAELDEQALAKMLGGKLGRSCRKIIAEEVPKLVEENATLREDSRMLEWLLDNCSTFVTVDHTTGEPDIYIIEASREAIREQLEKG